MVTRYKQDLPASPQVKTVSRTPLGQFCPFCKLFCDWKGDTSPNKAWENSQPLVLKVCCILFSARWKWNLEFSLLWEFCGLRQRMEYEVLLIRYRTVCLNLSSCPCFPLLAVFDQILAPGFIFFQMLLRKRALALRKFTVIRREDGMPLEEDQEFRLVCVSPQVFF